MRIRSVLAALAVALGVSVASADPMGSQVTIARGTWCSDFASTKAYADANNIPLIVFWANPGCHYCEMMETALNKEDFKTWQAKMNVMMVFSYDSSKDHTACKKFAKNSSGEYPYMAIYWKSNTKGVQVLETFSGKSGKMGAYGASSKDTLQQQFMDAVEDILPDWNPSGTVTPEPVDPEPVEPEPVTPVIYTVKFVVDTAKGTVSGTLTQSIESGKAATAPSVTAKEGWKFTGWDKTFSKVTANLTVTAKFSAVTVTPEPEPGEREEVSAATVYKKARSLTALVYEDGDIIGTATLKLAKINSRLGTVKASLAVKRFTGSSATASFTVAPNAYGDLIGTLPFKSAMGGAMDCSIVYDDGEFTLEASNDTYSVELGEVKLGGAFDTDELSFSADIDLELSDGWDFVVDPPSGEPVYVRSGTKLSFNKTPSIKYKKIKEDGEVSYELIGLDDDIRTNLTGLKLSYKSSTGVFSGSFKLYYSNESYTEKAPKLKSLAVKVSGIVVNGAGVGVVTAGRTKGTCTLD